MMVAMKSNSSRNWRPVDLLISFLVFGILLCFTYAYLFVDPYAGFYFNPSDGEILEIYENKDAPTGLKVGDFIEKIGSITWDEYHDKRNVSFFQGVQVGDILTITVQRDGKLISIPWVYPGFNKTEFTGRFFNVWWLAYVFWIFGTAAQIAMRPRNLRWRLLISANYLTALFIIFGNLSARQIWMSSAFLHAVAWLILPVYIQFHWMFPTPLRSIPHWAWIAFYAASLGLAAAEVFLLLPRSLYFIAVLLALVGSMILLFVQFFRSPTQRGTIRILLAGALLALLPTIIVSVLGSNGRIPQIGPLSLLALPIMPATYFYAVYRSHLGGLELRSNRAISIYAFLILLGTALLILMGFISSVNISQETTIFVLIIIAVIMAWLTIHLFPAFQVFAERHVLGIRFSYGNLLEIYSARITTSTSLSSLLELLSDEVFPSLLIRQFMFLQLENGIPKILLASAGVTEEQPPIKEALPDPETLPGKYPSTSLDGRNQNHPWARLTLPLYLGEDLIGLWLLGRRDPDDTYSQAEIPILQSLANQTAIALSNIIQTERLRKMYENDIERNEKSRLQLALDLHDSVLNQLAVLRLSVDDAHISPNFLNAYEEVTRRLREIVTDLRPPMLTYGLKSAIQELADNLMERSKDTVNIGIDLKTKDEVRYAENMEHHLYRIVQESCENAMRHGKSENITISGRLDPQVIQLMIEDDGSGFEVGENLNLESLLANKHFGLAGIMERANLIGAEFSINSAPGRGARVRVVWKPDQLKDQS